MLKIKMAIEHRTPELSRKDRKRQEAREEILDAAELVVLRDGYTGFSLQTVADDLGLTKPALYYYFKSKEALVFEVWLREWMDAAHAVAAAVAGAADGQAAVAVMMRTLFARYQNDLARFRLVHSFGSDVGRKATAADLERLRPSNDLLYGGAETKLIADQTVGRFPRERDPRRFVFTAHTAVMGLLTMKTMVESADDPLVHPDESLIDDLCDTFCIHHLEGVK
jgi:AcrR family transcriptional regulator